jgi:hypothetical protein
MSTDEIWNAIVSQMPQANPLDEHNRTRLTPFVRKLFNFVLKVRR